MEATLNEYKDAVKAQVDACTDVSLLDLIFKLLVKRGRRPKNSEIISPFSEATATKLLDWI